MPGIAFPIVVVAIAVAALALRPWDGELGSATTTPSDDRRAIEAPASAGTPGARTAETVGPHGEAVPDPDPGDRDEPAGEVPAASGATAAPAAWPTGYQWPITNARITNGYGLGRPGSFVVDGTPFHDGIDLASFCGAPITAAHAGTVLAAGRHHEAFIGWVGDLAPMRAKLDAEDAWRRQAITVVVDDGNGYRSIYAHLGLSVVAVGDVVEAGTLLGYEGASGNATGCHLHFAVFSPLEETTLVLDPRIARKSKLPAREIARIDPLGVLPPPADAGITWGWGAR